jgi:hypothetical protein
MMLAVTTCVPVPVHVVKYFMLAVLFGCFIWNLHEGMSSHVTSCNNQRPHVAQRLEPFHLLDEITFVYLKIYGCALEWPVIITGTNCFHFLMIWRY